MAKRVFLIGKLLLIKMDIYLAILVSLLLPMSLMCITTVMRSRSSSRVLAM